MKTLTGLDRWLLARVPQLRPLASYSVVSLFKPGPEADSKIAATVQMTFPQSIVR
jgi:hypothetical protein